jgi:hypothetical protein
MNERFPPRGIPTCDHRQRRVRAAFVLLGQFACSSCRYFLSVSTDQGELSVPQKVLLGTLYRLRAVFPPSKNEIAQTTKQPANLARRVIVIDEQVSLARRAEADGAFTILGLNHCIVVRNGHSIFGRQVVAPFPSLALRSLFLGSVAFSLTLFYFWSSAIIAAFLLTLFGGASSFTNPPTSCPAEFTPNIFIIGNAGRFPTFGSCSIAMPILNYALNALREQAVRTSAVPVETVHAFLRFALRARFELFYDGFGHSVSSQLGNGLARPVHSFARVFGPFCILP